MAIKRPGEKLSGRKFKQVLSISWKKIRIYFLLAEDVCEAMGTSFPKSIGCSICGQNNDGVVLIFEKERRLSMFSEVGFGNLFGWLVSGRLRFLYALRLMESKT